MLNREAISRSGWARDYDNPPTVPVIARLDSQVLRRLLSNFQIRSYMIVNEFNHVHIFGSFDILCLGNIWGKGHSSSDSVSLAEQLRKCGPRPSVRNLRIGPWAYAVGMPAHHFVRITIHI